MNWHHMTYFISIIITAMVMGFIAWYSRKNRNTVAVAGVYMWVALLVCLLSIFQGISMIGPTEQWARFWFNMRIGCFALIPVLWLMFVLRYVGKPALLSKTTIALLFGIPVITQAMLWTNDWHGLWVVRDVGFHEAGVFFIPETAVRVIGPWYMVHNLYTYGIMLAGIVILLTMSARLYRQYRGQAVLLGIGTMVMIIGSLFPTLNLFPGMELQPLPQSFALGSLIIAWALYRHRFLGAMPLFDREKSIPYGLIALFVVMTVGILIAGFLNYSRYREHHRAEIERQLSVIADLKVNEIIQWRKERMGDGEVLYKNAAFTILARRFIANPADVGAQWLLWVWLDTLKSSYNYDQIYLLAADGSLRMSASPNTGPVSNYLLRQLTEIGRTGKITFLDFYREAQDKRIYLSLVVPVKDRQSGNNALGFVVLVIDPTIYLYPMINSWPTTSPTAETLLIRREGSEALFLNELRFKKNTALNFKISLSQTNVAAVMAASGQEGVVEGIDYRGVPVIAALRVIPGSPWYMVARMDLSEVYAPVRERLWVMIIVVLGLISGGGAGAGFLWRRQSERFYREQFEAAEDLRLSEEKFSRAFQTSPYAIIISTLEDGRFIDVNEAFCAITGFTRDEVMGRGFVDVELWANRKDRTILVRELMSGIKVSDREVQFKKKNGEIIIGIFSADVIDLKSGRFILSSINDITERKKAERMLESQYILLNALINSTSDIIIFSLDRNYCYTIYNEKHRQEMKKIWGADIAIGTNILDLMQVPEFREPAKKSIDRALNGESFSEIQQQTDHDIYYEFTWNPIKQSKGTVGVTCFIRDITERRSAEEKLRASEFRFRSLFENMLNGFAYCKMLYEEGAPVDFIYLDVNAAFETLTGLKDVAGKKVSEVIPGIRQSDPELFERYSRVAITGIPETFETFVEALKMWFSISVYSPEREYFVAVFDVITERKRAEESLRASESFLDSIIEHSPHAMWISDERGTLIRLNQACRNLLNITDDEVIGIYNVLEDRIVEEQGFLPLVRNVFEKGETARFTLMYDSARLNDLQLRNRVSLTLEVTISPVLLASGQVAHAIIQHVDITERTRAEEAMRASEVRYRRLFEAAKDGIIILDADTGMIMDINPYLVQMLGFSHEFFLEKAIWDIGFFKDIIANKDKFLELQKKEYVRYEDLPLQTADGQRIDVEFVSNVYEIDHKKVIQCNIRNIMERKQAEKALQESERKFRETVKNLDEGYYGVTPDGLLLDHNLAFNRILGIDIAQDMRGSRLPDFWQSPDDRTGYLNVLMTQGFIRNYMINAKKISGEKVVVMASAHLVKDEKGRIVRIEGTFADFTEHKRMETALKESEVKYRNLFDNAQVGMYRTKIDGSAFLEVNDKFTEVFGYSREELLETPARTLWANPEDRDKMRRLLEEQGGILVNYEVQVTVRSGEVKYLLTSIQLHQDEGILDGSMVDITERKRAEEEIRRLNESLENRVLERTAQLKAANAAIAYNASRIEDLYNRAPCGYHSLDENGFFIEINDTELEWLGYSREEIINTVMFRDIITEDSRKVFEANFPVFMERGYVHNLEFDMVRKDGSIFPILVNASAIRDTSGRYLRSRSTVMDFSEVKGAREEMVKYSAKLEAANKELEAFSYSVSHDLRAPLRSIDGFSQAVLEDYSERLDDKGRDYLNRIRTASQRMALLIDDILKLSRVNRSEIRFTPTDLSGLVRTVAGELSEREPGRDARFIITESVTVSGDPALLSIAMENLLGNAWKFTSKRSGAVIEFGIIEREGERTLFVRDNGAGFDMQYTERLFGAFQRLHTADEFEGTGIGLTLVQRIINRHGGRIWAEGGVDKGATIFFTLPYIN
jgi:PAS domain S-box-containing protein